VLGGIVAITATMVGLGALILSGWQAYAGSPPVTTAVERSPAPLRAAA
jgi:hypothetical protein